MERGNRIRISHEQAMFRFPEDEDRIFSCTSKVSSSRKNFLEGKKTA